MVNRPSLSISTRVEFYLRYALCVLLLGLGLMRPDAADATPRNVIENIKHAVRILKGIDGDATTDWAVSTLRKAAEQDSVPYAMNSLGLIYMAGIGVEKDTTLAVEWLERAAVNGFCEAYHNLGMLYKDASAGGGQDFTKACEYFMAGAEQGSVMCMYDAGYMLYKGLGCKQSYAKAAELFGLGTARDHSPCLYMLGLCYRNGYGVEQDADRAGYYLRRAAELGYSPAIEELQRPYAENYMHEEFIADNTYGDVPANMPDIRTENNDISLFTGCMQGFIVMYDWSGRYILGEKPISLEVSRKGSEITGVMTLATDTVPFRAVVDRD